jgi:hypothetical protein
VGAVSLAACFESRGEDKSYFEMLLESWQSDAWGSSASDRSSIGAFCLLAEAAGGMWESAAVCGFERVSNNHGSLSALDVAVALGRWNLVEMWLEAGAKSMTSAGGLAYNGLMPSNGKAGKKATLDASGYDEEQGAERIVRAREILFEYMGGKPDATAAARELALEAEVNVLRGESRERMVFMCEELVSLCEARELAESLGDKKMADTRAKTARSL